MILQRNDSPEYVQRFDLVAQFWQYLRGLRVDDLITELIQNELAEQDRALLYKYRKAKIDFEEIKQNSQDKVLLAKDSRYFRTLCSRLQPCTKASAIFSMWHGYLERSDLGQFLQTHDIPMTEIHTSGHAYISQLKRLADALKPRFIIPIHTFFPDQYSVMFPNVLQLKDGEKMSLE